MPTIEQLRERLVESYVANGAYDGTNYREKPEVARRKAEAQAAREVVLWGLHGADLTEAERGIRRRLEGVWDSLAREEQSALHEREYLAALAQHSRIHRTDPTAGFVSHKDFHELGQIRNNAHSHRDLDRITPGQTTYDLGSWQKPLALVRESVYVPDEQELLRIRIVALEKKLAAAGGSP